METFLVRASLFIHVATPPLFFVVLCALVVVALVYTKRTYEATLFTIAFLCTTVTILLLKHLFAVARPADALVVLTDYAFPSSHAAFSAFLATMIPWLFLRSASYTRVKLYVLSVSVFTLAGIITVSRLIIGVHTPFQVAVGFLLGVLIPLTVIRLMGRVVQRGCEITRRK
jgi:undecaprenyl-diphosphatase